MDTSTVTRYRLSLFVRTRKPIWDLSPTGIQVKNDLDVNIAYAVIERRMLGTLGESAYYWGVYGLVDEDLGLLVAVPACVTKVKPNRSFKPSEDGVEITVEQTHRQRRTHPDGGILSLRMDIAKRAHQVSKLAFGNHNPSTLPTQWLEDEDFLFRKSRV